jgi:hypothetical protein
MYPIQFNDSNNIIVTNVRHRAGDYGGGDATGDGGNFVFYNCHNVVFDKISTSGYTDESVDFYGGCHDFTILDCIIGEASTGHTSLQYMIASSSYNGTCYHNLSYKGGYRSPAISWLTSGGVAPGIVGDIVNNLDWKYISYGITCYYGGKANAINNYFYNTTHPGSSDRALNIESNGSLYSSGNYSKDGAACNYGNASTPFTVAGPAQISPDSPAIAAAYIVANAGCRVGGLDAIDQAIIADINGVGL